MAGKPLLLTAESEDKVALQAFQFTPLCWERHAMPESDVPDSPFQSTSPCAGGDVQRFCDYEIGFISIHAPLCGGRPQNCTNIKVFVICFALILLTG